MTIARFGPDSAQVLWLYNNCGPLGDAWASQEILGPPALGHPWVSMGILEGPMDLLDASQLKLSGKS